MTDDLKLEAIECQLLVNKFFIEESFSSVFLEESVKKDSERIFVLNWRFCPAKNNLAVAKLCIDNFNIE